MLGDSKFIHTFAQTEKADMTVNKSKCSTCRGQKWRMVKLTSHRPLQCWHILTCIFFCNLASPSSHFWAFSTVSNPMKPCLGPAESAMNSLYSSTAVCARITSHYTILGEHRAFSSVWVQVKKTLYISRKLFLSCWFAVFNSILLQCSVTPPTEQLAEQKKKQLPLHFSSQAFHKLPVDFLVESRAVKALVTLLLNNSNPVTIPLMLYEQKFCKLFANICHLETFWT